MSRALVIVDVQRDFLPGAELDPRLPHVDAIVDKGVLASGPGDSGFESDALRELVREHGVEAATIVGLATDVCVAATASDALDAGIAATIERRAVRGIDPGESERALSQLSARGAAIT